MGQRPRRPAPVARTRRCAFLLENLNLQKATGDKNAVYEDLQIDMWNDTSISRCDNKARQGGWSFGAAMDGLAAGWLEPGTICNFSSYNREETKEKIRYIKAGIAALWPGVRPEIVIDNTYELEIDNGSRFIGWPSKPPRGKGRARYYIDEWAHIARDKEIKTAASGGIGRGGIVRGGSTPLGQRGVFHELMTQVDEYKSWVRKTWPWWHFYGLCTDVARAVVEAPGMPTSERVAKFGTFRLQAAYESFGTDEEGFKQEYEGAFIDEEGAFFSYKLIMSCEADFEPITLDAEGDYLMGSVVPGAGPLGLGIDVGRHHDRSVAAGVQRLELLQLVLLDIMNQVPFPKQERRLKQHIEELDVLRTCIDEGGMGTPLRDYLRDAFGRARVEGVTLSQPVKERLMTKLKALFENGEIVIPVDKRLRAALHKIRQVRLPGGRFRYDSEADDQGHADEAWALALGVDAVQTAKTPFTMDGGSYSGGSKKSRRSGWRGA